MTIIKFEVEMEVEEDEANYLRDIAHEIHLLIEENMSDFVVNSVTPKIEYSKSSFKEEDLPGYGETWRK